MNITYDTQGSATFMVYSMDPQEQIDNIGLGMITNNKMKGVIPIAFTQFDDVRQLRFNVSSMISLKNFLDVRVTRSRVLNVFSSICDAFIAADDFLLDRDMFMMDPNYIFTYVSSGETKLVYLPIVRETAPTDLCRFFKEMMFTMQTDPGENTEYVAKIINFLNKPEDFNLEKFRTLINALKQEGALPSSAEPKAQQQNSANGYFFGSQTQQPSPSFGTNRMQGGSMSFIPGGDSSQNAGRYAPGNLSAGQQTVQMPSSNNYQNGSYSSMNIPQGAQTSPAYETPSGNNYGSQHGEFEIPGGGTMRQSTAPASQKKVLFTFLGRPIGGGLTKEEKEQWIEEERRKKEEKKNKKGLFGKKEQSAQNKASNTGFEIPGANTETYSSTSQPQYSQPQYSQPQYSQSQYSSPQYSQPQYSQPQYSQNPANGGLNGGTVVLNNYSQAQGTTVLNTSMKTLTGAPILNPYLVRCKTNEEIRITKDTFRIGKERSYVDYFILDNPTVSRSHADIVKRGEEYFIKDNNSMNHTFMEGQQLDPNREYPLKSGMHFILSNEEFEFKLR